MTPSAYANMWAHLKSVFIYNLDPYSDAAFMLYNLRSEIEDIVGYLPDTMRRLYD